jgi:hypothetical protein
MAVRNFTVKFSGTVAYTDNSHGSFESTAIWRGELGGVVASHNTADSQYNLSQLYADQPVNVQAMLDALVSGPTTAITLSPPTTTPDKTVESFVAELSGGVSYDDGSSNGLFISQWVSGVVNLFPLDSPVHWAAIVADPVASAFLVTALEELTGTGNATV